MRRHRLALVARALADHEAADQAGDARIDVHHGAARKVERALAPQIAMVVGQAGGEVRARPVPDHVRHRIIDQDRPGDDEEDQRRELHPLGKGADDQRGRDHREGHLEDDEGRLGQIDAVREGRGEGVGVDALHQRLGEAADEQVERAAIGEGHRIADGDPEQPGDADDGEHLHQYREHVLGAHQAAIEERQARHRHHQHQRGGDQHPADVALVDHRVGRHDRRGGRRLCQRRPKEKWGGEQGAEPRSRGNLHR